MGFPRDFLVLLAIPVVLRWRCYCPLEGICKCAGEFRLVTVTGDPEGKVQQGPGMLNILRGAGQSGTRYEK